MMCGFVIGLEVMEGKEEEGGGGGRGGEEEEGGRVKG